MNVKPQEGKIVRDPDTGVKLPASGRNVPNNSYWRRRLAAGDVTPAEVSAKPAPAEAPEPAKGTKGKNKDK